MGLSQHSTMWALLGILCSYSLASADNRPTPHDQSISNKATIALLLLDGRKLPPESRQSADGRKLPPDSRPSVEELEVVTTKRQRIARGLASPEDKAWIKGYDETLARNRSSIRFHKPYSAAELEERVAHLVDSIIAGRVAKALNADLFNSSDLLIEAVRKGMHYDYVIGFRMKQPVMKCTQHSDKERTWECAAPITLQMMLLRRLSGGGQISWSLLNYPRSPPITIPSPLKGFSQKSIQLKPIGWTVDWGLVFTAFADADFDKAVVEDAAHGKIDILGSWFDIKYIASPQRCNIVIVNRTGFQIASISMIDNNNIVEPLDEMLKGQHLKPYGQLRISFQKESRKERQQPELHITKCSIVIPKVSETLPSK